MDRSSRSGRTESTAFCSVRATRARYSPQMHEDTIKQERRELLLHAIDDIQGSIHANDTKSSAGLVVHGLLATGVVALLSRLGGIYGRGTDSAQFVIRGALAVALVLFVLSVLSLLYAV